MSFSSMYIAATGMIALGTGMQTISNNLANVETNGFKTMRTNYSDLISKTILASAPFPTRQVGHGSQVQSIQSMFTQGAFKRSESPLDLALAGDGFFNVRSRLSYYLPKSDEIMYSRAGAFTLDRNGYMEDQSGNILQGWAMSLPRPGETPVRLGSPVDVQITTLILPPRATTAMRQVANLDADAKTVYDYPAYELAERLAKERAELAGQAARGPATLAAWNPAVDQPTTAVVEPSGYGVLSASNKDEFNKFFLEHYLELFNPGTSALSGDPAVVIASAMSLVAPGALPNRSSGQMTLDEFNILTALAQADMDNLAGAAGQAAYSTAYNNTYDAVYRQYSTGVPAANQWQWEGNGFAGAWDGSLSPPMDPKNYSHAEHQIVYDAAGNAHVLTTYYQKNPHAENVWDYIVTCEPDEDDRLDSAGRPLTGTPQAGLLQKGKITFDANGKIKDMEAQDFNPAASRGEQLGWAADAPNAAGYFTVDAKFRNAP
ncbi:MAG: flagellar hook-basal body complex protein, partial [Candidatus Adiutrix sp.]|nr:flagellar hook-basal body complex protein [Candidatus Adiutrix sp.]